MPQANIKFYWDGVSINGWSIRLSNATNVSNFSRNLRTSILFGAVLIFDSLFTVAADPNKRTFFPNAILFNDTSSHYFVLASRTKELSKAISARFSECNLKIGFEGGSLTTYDTFHQNSFYVGYDVFSPRVKIYSVIGNHTLPSEYTRCLSTIINEVSNIGNSGIIISPLLTIELMLVASIILKYAYHSLLRYTFNRAQRQAVNNLDQDVSNDTVNVNYNKLNSLIAQIEFFKTVAPLHLQAGVNRLSNNITEFENQFSCPIGRHIMENPSTVSSGITFEQSQIKAYLQGANTACPFSRKPLIETARTALNTNVVIKNILERTLNKLEKQALSLHASLRYKVFTPTLNLPSVSLKSFSTSGCTFFQRLENQYLEEHRQKHPELQKEYDKRLGLVLYQSGNK